MNLIKLLYILPSCVIVLATLHYAEATFGTSCTSDADCSTPSETCSTNCRCSTGYNHDGNGVCLVVDCGTPTDPTNGGITVTATTYQNTGTVTCESGYTMIGSSPITCSSTGNWTTIPTCESKGVSPMDFSCFNTILLALIACKIYNILHF